MFQTLRRAAFPALGLAVAAGLAVKVCCHDGGKVEISPELTNKKQIDRGPGVGKGTQCSRLEKEFGLVHLSAGDLLRAERNRPGSQWGDLINNYIREGKIVPYEITIGLLRKAMLESGGKSFLIDGFPRDIEQGLAFEDKVCPTKAMLAFECSEAEMLDRLLRRSETSGRVDDNRESILKRFATFRTQTIPVFEWYEALGKLRRVNCSGGVDEVYDRTRQALLEILNEK